MCNTSFDLWLTTPRFKNTFYLLVVFVKNVRADFYELRLVKSGGELFGIGHVEHEHRRPDRDGEIRPKRKICRARFENHLGPQHEVEHEVGRGGHDDPDEGHNGPDGRGQDKLFLLMIHRLVAVAVQTGVRHFGAVY